MGKLTGITQLSKMLNLINQKTKKPSWYTLPMPMVRLNSSKN